MNNFFSTVFTPVKVSERLPEKDGEYLTQIPMANVKQSNFFSVEHGFYWINNKGNREYSDLNLIQGFEWLEPLTDRFVFTKEELDLIIGWEKNKWGHFVCGNVKPMPDFMKGLGRWEHEKAHEIECGSDYFARYKCDCCGQEWKEELPE